MILIRQRNDDLVTLANGGRKPTSDSGSPNSPTNSHSLLITYHQQVQHHAKFLYSMLREKLEPPTCKCGVPHSAQLELKMRSTPPTKALSKSQADLHGPNQFFTFSLMFSTQHGQPTAIWHEFQLEPINGYGCRKSAKGPVATQTLPRHTVAVILSPSSGSSSLPIAVPTAERGRSVAQPPNPSPLR